MPMPSSSFTGALVNRTTEAVVVAQAVALKSAAAMKGIENGEEADGELMVDVAIEGRMQFIDLAYPPLKNSKPAQRNYKNYNNVDSSISNPTSWVRLEHSWKRLQSPPQQSINEVTGGSHSNRKWLSIIARLSSHSMVKYDPSVGYAKVYFSNQPSPTVIDDYVPWRDTTPLHCQTSPCRFYLVLIEKAVSKLLGSYANLSTSITSTEDICSYFGYGITEFLFTDGLSLFESEMQHKFSHSENSSFLSDFVVILKPLSAPTVRLDDPLSMYFVRGVADSHVVVDTPLSSEEHVIPISRMGSVFYSWAVAQKVQATDAAATPRPTAVVGNNVSAGNNIVIPPVIPTPAVPVVVPRNSAEGATLTSPTRWVSSVMPRNSSQIEGISESAQIRILEAENRALVDLHISQLEEGIQKLPIESSVTERVRLLKATLHRLQSQDTHIGTGSGAPNFALTDNNYKSLVRLISKQQQRISDLQLINAADRSKNGSNIETEMLIADQKRLTAEVHHKDDRERKLMALIEGQQSKIRELEQEITQSGRGTDPEALLRVIDDQQAKLTSLSTTSNDNAHHLTELVIHLKSEIANLEKENYRLQQVPSDEIKRCADLISQQRDQIQSLEDELNTMRKQPDDPRLHVSSIGVRNPIGGGEVAPLSLTVDQISRVKDIEEQSRLHAIIESQQNLLSEVRETLHVEKKTNDALAKVVDEQKQQLETEAPTIDMVSENTMLLQLVSDLRIKHEVDSGLIAEQQQQISQLQLSAASPTGLAAENQKLLSLITHLQEQLATSTGGDNAALLRLITDQKSKIDGLERDLETLPGLNETIKQLQETVTAGKAIEDEQREEVAKLKSDLVSKDEAYTWDSQQHVQQKDDLRKQLEEKDRQLTETSDQVTDLQQQLEQLNSSLGGSNIKTDLLRSEKAELEATLATHLEATASLQEDKAQLAEAVSRQEDMLKSLNQEKETLKAELTRQTANVDLLREERTQLQTSIEKCQHTIGEMKEEKRTLQATLESRERDVASLKTEKAQLDNKLQQNENEFNRLNSEKQALQESVASHNEQNIILRHKLETLEDEKADMLEKISKSKSDAATSPKTQPAPSEEVEQLTMALEIAEEKIAKSAAARDLLRDSMEQRMQTNAFHLQRAEAEVEELRHQLAFQFSNSGARFLLP